MTNRDDIIRKLNAIKAKANNAGTPEEAMAFANAFEKMMAKYRLTETDLEVKSSKVESFTKKPRKETDKMELICKAIAKLTDTYAVKSEDNKNIIFYGLPVDLQYANWLYDLISDSLITGYHKLPMTVAYHRLINNGVKGDEIKHNFKLGFLVAGHESLVKMIAEKEVAGNALIVLKQDIILREMTKAKGQKTSKKDIALYTGSQEIAGHGYEEGSKVKLSKGVESEVKGYLE